MFTIIDYIRSTVEIIMNLKAEEVKESLNSQQVVGSTENPPIEYEQLLQNLEAEVRSHVRMEQQLKLNVEQLQFKQDDLESHNKELKKAIKELNDVIYAK